MGRQLRAPYGYKSAHYVYTPDSIPSTRGPQEPGFRSSWHSQGPYRGGSVSMGGTVPPAAPLAPAPVSARATMASAAGVAMSVGGAALGLAGGLLRELWWAFSGQNNGRW